MSKIWKVIIVLAIIVQYSMAIAQDIPGYNMSNYSGVSGIDIQPASIADMKYKVDITLIGAGLDINNNYISLKGQYLRDGTVFQNYEGDFKTHFLTENKTEQVKQVGLNIYAQLPSAAVTITRNTSVAFTCRFRTMFNVDGLNYPLAHLLYTGLSSSDPENKKFFNQKLNNNLLNINQLSWMEYGLTLGQVLYNKGHHFYKMGARVKLESGLEAAYFYAEKLDYNWKNHDTLSLYQSLIKQGHTQNLVDYANGNFNPAKAFFNTAASSVAMDLGFVYEWRPDYYEYHYHYAAQYKNDRRDIPKYKLRLGVSVLDLGYFSFNKADQVYDIEANKIDWNVHALKYGPNKLYGYDTIVARYLSFADTRTKFYFYLPTSISLQADYQLYKDLYLNFTAYISPQWLNLNSEVHSLSYYVITPRWDNKWFGVFLPVGINGYGLPTAGLTVRLGPLIVGTGNGFNLLFDKDIYGLNAYAALKIPILYPNPTKKSKAGKDNCPKF